MLKKRAILYFLVIAFPMGLGAGASSWLKLPTLHLSPTTTVAPPAPEHEAPPPDPRVEQAPEIHFPDFGVVHPLVVGTFSLLFCTGILLAADKPKAS